MHHPNYHLTIPVGGGGGEGVTNYCGGKAVKMRPQ